MSDGLHHGARPGWFRRTALSIVDRLSESGGILSYHAVVRSPVPSPAMHISGETLGEQLAFLAERCTIVPLGDLVDRHMRRRSTSGYVAITFDDAYQGVAAIAAPVLKSLDLPATVFVTTNNAAAGSSYWWDELEALRIADDRAPWGQAVERLGLPSLDADAGSIERIRSHILAKYAGRYDVTAPAGIGPGPLVRSMTFDELRALASDGEFDFACHTRSHPALPFLAPEEQEEELRGSLRRLRDELPRVNPFVAYPYGLYDRATVAAAARAGIRAGLSMQARGLSGGDELLALPRVGVSEDWTAEAVALRLNRALRPLFVARSGGLHPELPGDNRETAGTRFSRTDLPVTN